MVSSSALPLLRRLIYSSVPLEDWQQSVQFNSPQSIRQAMFYGAAAIFLVMVFFALGWVLPTVAEGSAVKGKVTPCRRV